VRNDSKGEQMEPYHISTSNCRRSW
jgi:hypothetical protein